MGAYVCTKPYAFVFTAALFVKAKNWKQPKCHSLLNGWMEKQTLVHRDCEVLLKIRKNNWAHLKQLGWGSRTLLWKKLTSKGFILYNSIYITCSKWQNYGDGEQVSGCRGWGLGLAATVNSSTGWVYVTMEQFCIPIMMVFAHICTCDNIS